MEAVLASLQHSAFLIPRGRHVKEICARRQDTEPIDRSLEKRWGWLGLDVEGGRIFLLK